MVSLYASLVKRIMKNVFIFGAGASRQSGAPLMADFLDSADRLLRARTPGVIQAEDSFRDVYNARGELGRIYEKSYLDITNIEGLFGVVEMAQLLKRFASRDAEGITKLRQSLATLIVKTLECSIQFPVSGGSVRPPKPFDDFVGLIKNIQIDKKGSDYSWCSFITFNYDVNLDFALYWQLLPFEYFIQDTPATNSFPLLKLHGSINWGVCSQCNQIIPYHVKDASHHLWPETRNVFFDLGSKLSSRQHCNEPLLSTPVIIPPTWDKSAYQSQIAHVWQQASKELQRAENIFIIGYSLPETDMFFRYMFALGLEGPTIVQRIWVVNPDQSIEERFREFIGRGIESRLRFIYAPFNDLVSRTEFKSVLEEP
ncbi:MAG: hypothetical protein ACE5Q6_14895 [Dehalococcoidia bacterium]